MSVSDVEHSHKEHVPPPEALTPNAEVLLIHGTAAGDPHDTGTKWWQRESTFSRSLDELLGRTSLTCLTSDRVFHWGVGQNSERKRRQAGRELYEFLLTYEKAGKPYHIIAHSHGGSVTWHALIESVAEDRILSSLQSWSTVGTPFLRFGVDWWELWAIAPFCASILALMMIRTQAAEIVHLWPALAQAKTLVSTLTLVSIGLLIAGAFVLTLSHLLRLGFAWLSVGRRKRLDNACWKAYGERWFGMASKEDEAINGLSATLGFSGDIVPRASSWGTSALTRTMSALAAPLRRIYNGCVAPIGDQFIWDRVTRKIQGADLAGETLLSVSRAPVRNVASASLPEALERELQALASREAAATLVKVRSLMSTQSVDPDLPDFLLRAQLALSWNELIHNSYFDHAEVCVVLSRRITQGSSDETAAFSAPAVSGSSRRRRPPGVLLAATTASVLTLVVATVTVSSQILFSRTVETFTDKYQIDQIKAHVPLKDAMATSDGIRTRGLLLGHWTQALVSLHDFNAVETVGVQFDDGLPYAAETLMLNGRKDLVDDMLKRRLRASQNDNPDCGLAEAITHLLTSGHVKEANGLRASMETRGNANGQDVRCQGRLGNGDAIESTQQAREGVYLAIARNAARDGVSPTAIAQWSDRFSDDETRAKFYETALESYLDKQDADTAYAIYSVCLTLPLDPVKLARLSELLAKKGRMKEADEIQAAALERIDELMQPGASRNLYKWEFLKNLASANAPRVAMALAAKVGESDTYKSMADDFISVGNLAAAVACIEHSDKKDLDGLYAKLVSAALKAGNISLARRVMGQPHDASFYAHLPEALASAGYLDDALATLPHSAERLSDLENMIEVVKEPQQKAEVARKLLEEARHASADQRTWTLTQALATLADHDARQDLKALANEIVMAAKSRPISPSVQNFFSFYDTNFVIYTLANYGFVDEAIAVHRSTMQRSDASSGMDSQTFMSVTNALSRADRISTAIDWCTAELRGADSLEENLCGPGAVLPLDGDVAQRTSQLEDKHMNADAFVYLVRAHRPDEALEVLNKIPAKARPKLAGEAFRIAVNDDDLELVRWARTLNLLADDSDAMLVSRVSELLSNKKFDQAARTAREISGVDSRAKALVECAAALPPTDDDSARALLAEALEALEAVPADTRVQQQPRVAYDLALRGEYRQARLLCDVCSSAEKVMVYSTIAQTYGSGETSAKKEMEADEP